MNVELIYDLDCPNADAARAALREALTRLDLPVEWTEWNRKDPAAPAYVRGYGSPSVLVAGRDVGGVEGRGQADTCRIYDGPQGLGGVPPVESIVAALAAEAGVVEPARRSRNWWTIPLAAMASLPALLPVGICPACWPAYAGLLGALGLGFLLESKYLLPVMVLFFALALAALAYRAPTRRGYGPFLVGTAAVFCTLFFKFVFDVPLASYVGLGGLIAASVWNAWPKKAVAGGCPHCVSPDSHTP